MDKNGIGLKIKNLRKTYKLTQKQLADKINKSVETIKKYENESIEIPLKVLNEIADVLEVPMVYFVDTIDGNYPYGNLHGMVDATDFRKEHEFYFLNKYQLVSHFNRLAASVGIDVSNLPTNDQAVFDMITSPEFKTCIELLCYKYSHQTQDGN